MFSLSQIFREAVPEFASFYVPSGRVDGMIAAKMRYSICIARPTGEAAVQFDFRSLLRKRKKTQLVETASPGTEKLSILRERHRPEHFVTEHRNTQ